MAQPTRYLTKSCFKLAAECPRKLFFTGKKDFVDRSSEDSFLAALAEGGYQVGELACLMHPGGVRVDDLEHPIALARTAELLKKDRVIIFEAALAVGQLFIRVDILVKDGEYIDLIEVKAKSYSAKEDGDFRGKHGLLKPSFLPYLRDVAFQRYVAQQALPSARVRTFLMLADKDQKASVSGLNQQFRVTRDDGRLRVGVAAGTDLNSLGVPLLTKVSVDSQVDEILAGTLLVGPGKELPFHEAVATFAMSYSQDSPLAPIPTPACSSCQFKGNGWPRPGERRSGFHECWSESFGWEEQDFAEGSVLDIWAFTGKAKLMDQGVLKLSKVTPQDIGFDGEKPDENGMTRKHRQWYVCRRDWPGGGDFFFDREGFELASASWQYPLHFIDFETSAVAIPFVKGRRPYETTAFQFSHHVMNADGSVVHKTQWLNATPGVDPNYPFIRALMRALELDEGTIFRWATHENSVLNRIRQQLLEDAEPPADKDALLAFIESITERNGTGKEKVLGPRNMVDLCQVAERYFFHPSTKGSNSLKKVLPALMQSSATLKMLYGSETYGRNGSSLNLEEPIAWWREDSGSVIDPYRLLPPVFDDLSQEEVDALAEGASDELREGGAAMAAYARLQFENLPNRQRQAIEKALLRYCELDTLAMVMAFQAWTGWTRR